jgi:hypothetical protein
MLLMRDETEILPCLAAEGGRRGGVMQLAGSLPDIHRLKQLQPAPSSAWNIVLFWYRLGGFGREMAAINELMGHV